MKEKKFVSAVAYLYNDEDSVLEFLKSLDGYLFEKFEHYEIILVNDRSTDRTVGIIDENKKLLNSESVIILNLAWRHGLEPAMLAGTEMSIGDYVFEFDSTAIDYTFETLNEIYDKAANGFDIVGAYPDGPQKTTSKLFYAFLKKVSYLNLELTTENLKIVSRRALNRVLDLREKTRYRKALYRYSGFPCASVKYTPVKTAARAKRSLSERVSLAADVIFAFSDLGMKISIILSTLFFMLSLGIGFYAIVIYLTLKTVVTGWTTLSLFLSCGFSGIFLVLGILGKYLTMLLTEVQNRPSYIVRSVERINKND